jgi:prepilin peptidase CpaA
MHFIDWIAPTASFLEILLLLYVATIDIATRSIRNEICLVLALLGIAGQFASPMQVAESLIAATILFLLLIVIYQRGRGWMGGGDVKLLVALAIGLPLMGVIQLLTITALAGGVLAVVHLMMRLLPYPKLAPAGSSFVRRVYTVGLSHLSLSDIGDATERGREGPDQLIAFCPVACRKRCWECCHLARACAASARELVDRSRALESTSAWDR